MQTRNASIPVESWARYRRNMTVSAQSISSDAGPGDPDLAPAAALISVRVTAAGAEGLAVTFGLDLPQD